MLILLFFFFIIVVARRKTIYEYHRVNFDSQDIGNNTLISLTASPTCLGSKDCESCVTSFDPAIFKVRELHFLKK